MAKGGGKAFGHHCKTDAECAGNMVCTWLEQGGRRSEWDRYKYCTAKCELAYVGYSVDDGVWFDHSIGGKRKVEACGNYTWTTDTPLWHENTPYGWKVKGARHKLYPFEGDMVYARGYLCAPDYRTPPPNGDGRDVTTGVPGFPNGGRVSVIRTTMHGACYPVCARGGSWDGFRNGWRGSHES